MVGSFGTAALRGLPEREDPASPNGSSYTDILQAQKMEILEKNHAWKEPDFDTVLQYLRTVLLRRM